MNPEIEREDRLIKIQELCELTGYSPASIARHVEAGKLPRPIQLGGMGGHRTWRLSDVETALELKYSARERRLKVIEDALMRRPTKKSGAL